MKKYDVILTPTSPIVAFDIGTKSSNPMEMYLSDICTVPVNIAGVPAISIPCGVDSNNMPIGMQLIGNYFDEETILNAAYTYEQATNFRSKYRPKYLSKGDLKMSIEDYEVVIGLEQYMLNFQQKQRYFVTVLQNLVQNQIHMYAQYVWQCQVHFLY